MDPHESWHGIIDSANLHAEFCKRKEKHARWGKYKCLVMLVNGGQYIERYRQVGRMQKAKKSLGFFISHTFYDTLHDMSLEYERLRKDRKPCSGLHVVTEFRGNDNKKFKTRAHIVRAAIRLPIPVLDTMR